MFYSFKLYLADRWIMVMTLLALAVFCFHGWYAINHIRPTEENVFLHYNIVFGTDLVGEWQAQLLPLLVGAVILITNSFLSWMFYGSNRLLGRLLVSFSFFIQISLVVGQVFMLNLNL
ncbi:MAG: hypothetical protein A3I29_03990 [Candidatus Magasanikbacteria bacterium RIFCSPLOWO2_02_FULL_44_11]|uniref:Uncharacterized protein n=2 Tax=Candidatus Magasanikiibacteriota TaxID=1752731 RepID=A0A1F6N9W9_9BACT|nr:MAG: hypothetical protein A3D53_00505 [Candidatus Magasanikbacteria bacterium RIFCSPHIGHO2_02_FULL_45_10]OGH80578.1 MAG: hypothetical protein A3I29_03990 [Candidatus Magasanikbacteria bacterium RIFCSPLOWO2_02_FULL_44_11]